MCRRLFRLRFRVVVSAIVGCMLVGGSGFAGERWPGWMGENRDGVYRESELIDSIPESGLKIKWRTAVAGGYAGPAVAAGKVFVFDYVKTSGESFNDPGKRATVNGVERLAVLSEETGEQIWQHQYQCPYSISYPAGPRCTPTVDGDRVYILGAEGDLRCLRVDDGELVWKRSFKRDFGAKIEIWGCAAHPLIVDNLLITMVGGKGQGVVAFDKRTGDVQWKSLDARAGYCPPTLIESGGARQLIVYHPEAVVSLNPVNGEPFWNVSLAPKYGMSIARPMVEGNRMYVSGIGNAAALIELATDRPGGKLMWKGVPKKALFSANATPLFVDGVIYGSDCQMGNLVAVNADDGSRLWDTFEATVPEEKRRVSHGTAFLTRIGKTDRFLIFSETGDLLLARLSRAGFESLGRFHVLDPTGEAFGRDVVWSHPAYANRTAYIRNDREIVAVDLADPN